MQQSIKEEIEVKSHKSYDDIRIELENQLNSMILIVNDFPEIEDLFIDPLNNLFLLIQNASAISFNKTNSRVEMLSNNFDNLCDEINTSKNNFASEIFKITKFETIEFISNIKNQIYQIKELTEIFFQTFNESIEYEYFLIEQGYDSNFNFEITVYSDIIDTLNEIDKIYNQFSSGIKIAITAENLSFYRNVSEEFDNIVDPSLKYIEYISDMMKNNVSIIEGYKVFLGDEGDKKRIESIELIDSLRGKIENIINEMFRENELIYETFIKDLDENIKEEDYKQILKDGNKLINLLKEKKLVEFAQNFSIYNEDIKSIISIYMNVTQIRNNAYKEYIIKLLYSIKDNFVSSSYDSFKKDYDKIMENMTNKTKENNYSEAINISVTLNDKINEIFQKYFNSNFLNKIVTKYNNTSLFEEMAENYYNKVIPAFNEFNNTFFKKIYKSHIEDYITRPSEMEIRLTNISIIEEK